MIVASYQIPKSTEEFMRLLHVFLTDAFPSNCLNAGDTDDSLQVDFPPFPSRNTYFLTVETSEAYAKRLHPEESADQGNGQPATSEPETSEEKEERPEAPGDKLARLSVQRFAIDQVGRWVNEYANSTDQCWEMQAFPRSRSFILEAPLINEVGEELEGTVSVRLGVCEFDDSNTDVAEQRDLETQVAMLESELAQLRKQLAKSA